MNIEFDYKHPKELIKSVIERLSRRNDRITILFVDEVIPCLLEGQITSDWSNISTADNVVWILSLQPFSDGHETINLIPPVSDNVLSTKLVRGHRNCPEIR